MGWEPVKCRIPDHLERLRENQRWLTAEVDESEQQVSAYINMERIMGMKKGKKYSVALRCRIDDIYVWEYFKD